MFVMDNGLMLYHEQRVEEMTRQYQDSRWQQEQFVNQVRALFSRVGTWFGRGVESVPNAGDGRLESQPVRVHSR